MFCCAIITSGGAAQLGLELGDVEAKLQLVVGFLPHLEQLELDEPVRVVRGIEPLAGGGDPLLPLHRVGAGRVGGGRLPRVELAIASRLELGPIRGSAPHALRGIGAERGGRCQLTVSPATIVFSASAPLGPCSNGP